jgi:hypothetical protein
MSFFNKLGSAGKSAFYEAQKANHKANESQRGSAPARIVSAWYGQQGKRSNGADVTNEVVALIKDGLLNFRVDIDLFGDKAPGKLFKLFDETC